MLNVKYNENEHIYYFRQQEQSYFIDFSSFLSEITVVRFAVIYLYAFKKIFSNFH